MTSTQSYTQWKEDRLASRRLQILLIDPLLLQTMITGGEIRVRYELPADVSVLTIQPDSSGLFLHCLIHSETFDPVPPYERPPMWQGSVYQERVPRGPSEAGMNELARLSQEMGEYD